MNVLVGKRMRWSKRRLTGESRGQARANYIPRKGQVTTSAAAFGAQHHTGDRWLQKNAAIHFNVFDSGLARAHSLGKKKGGCVKLCHTRPFEASHGCVIPQRVD